MEIILAGALDKINEKAPCLPPGRLQLVGEEEIEGKKGREGCRAGVRSAGMRSVEYVWGGRQVGTGEGLGRVVQAGDLWKRRGRKGELGELGLGAMYMGVVVMMAWTRLAAMEVEPGLGIAVVATLIQ